MDKFIDFKNDLRVLLKKYGMKLQGYNDFDCFPYIQRFEIEDNNGNIEIINNDSSCVGYWDF